MDSVQGLCDLSFAPSHLQVPSFLYIYTNQFSLHVHGKIALSICRLIGLIMDHKLSAMVCHQMVLWFLYYLTTLIEHNLSLTCSYIENQS